MQIDCDGSLINLVTLYTSIKAERQSSIPPSGRVNRLKTSSNHMELTQAVSDLCRQADAYILILDATSGPSQLIMHLLLLT